MDQQIQICEVNNMNEKKLFDVDAELGLKIFIDEETLTKYVTSYG